MWFVYSCSCIYRLTESLLELSLPHFDSVMQTVVDCILEVNMVLQQSYHYVYVHGCKGLMKTNGESAIEQH